MHVEDGPKWTPTEVSTWGINGHFGASSRQERATETTVAGGREVPDRRTDFKTGRIGCAGGAGAWSNANQVFSWRRRYLQGLLSPRNAEPVKLLPVHVSEEQVSKVNRLDRRQVAAAGTIEMEFPKGHVGVAGSVDGEALRIVLEHLLR